MKTILILSFGMMLTATVFLSSCKSSTKKNVPDSASEMDSSTMQAPNQTPVKGIKLTKIWETEPKLTTSESVLFDADSGVYFVSCIGGVPPTKKDGDGFISIIDQRGKILNEKWASGLNAPKGMGIKYGKLYVTDITDLVIIDPKTGKTIKKIPVKGSSFLNDIAIGPDGKVYITDSSENTVYLYENGKVEVFIKEDALGGSNGIYVDHETMYIAGFGNGDIHTIDLESKKMTKRTSGTVPGGDGIEPWGGGYIVSNWNGEIYYVSSTWNTTKVLDTKLSKVNAADITINQKTGELLVPTFFDNRVVAYKIENLR